MNWPWARAATPVHARRSRQATPAAVTRFKRATLQHIYRVSGRVERVASRIRSRSGGAIDELNYKSALGTLEKDPAAMEIVERFRTWLQLRVAGGHEVIATAAYLSAGERYRAAVRDGSKESNRVAEVVVEYERRR